MAKKKGAKKKARSAADGELVLLLPADAYKEYEIMRDTAGLGPEAIKQILQEVFGNHANFHINSISIAEKDTFLATPDTEPQTFKC